MGVHIMGIFFNGAKGVGKFAAYPYVRVLQQVTESAQRAKVPLAQLKATHRRLFSVDGAVPEVSPEQAFVDLYQANGWTEVELKVRMWDLKVLRRSMLAVSVVVFFLLLFIVTRKNLPWWQLVIFGPMSLGALLMFGAQAAKAALMEFQIETRALVKSGALFSRSDFYSRLFR